MKNRVALMAAVVAASSFAVFGAGTANAAAPVTKTVVQTVDFDLGDLDNSGTAQLEQFDQSLGNLVSVKIATEVTMDLTACTTNRSEEAVSVAAGSATGTADLTFVGAATTADASLNVPGTELAAFGGTDGCADWQTAGGDPAVQPVGDNSSLVTASKTDTWSATLTGAATDPYVGSGTVGFDYGASSTSNLGQPSEWTIVFLANGVGKATVTYTYQEVADEVIDNPDDDGEVDEGTALPDTGGPAALWLILGSGLVVVGAGLVMVRRPHSA